MIKHFKSKQFIAFIITGGIAALVNFGSRIIYSLWFSFSFAIIFAYITGLITAYLLAKLFVFKDSQQALRRSIMFFILVNLFAIAQTWLISMTLVYYILPIFSIDFFTNEIAHAIGVAAPVFTSYLGHKHFSFKASSSIETENTSYKSEH